MVRDVNPRSFEMTARRSEKSSFTHTDDTRKAANLASLKSQVGASKASGQVIPMPCMTTGGETRRPYPKGRKLLMTARWKSSVDKWLSDNGKDRAWLADQLGVEQSTVKRMLEEQNTSALVETVCTLTGLPIPMVELQSKDDEEDLELLRQLATEDREQVRSLIRRFLPKK